MKQPIERRKFLHYLGAATLGPFIKNVFSIKRKSVEYLIPYIDPPTGVVAGRPDWYSSVCRQCSAGCGIQVKITDGRAKKIEGNPRFPVNYGRLCARGQAGLQVLYNPDRIKSPLYKDNNKFKKTSWSSSENQIAERLNEILRKNQGHKVAFITEPLRSAQGNILSTFASKFGSDNVYSYELFNNGSEIKANETCFGFKGIPNYDIAGTNLVLSFAADILTNWASPVKHSVGYGAMREHSKDESKKRGALIQFESRLSLTGTNSDEWFPVKPGTEGLVALAIANVIVNKNLSHVSINAPELEEWKSLLSEYSPEEVSKISGVKIKSIEEVAETFANNQPAFAIAGSQAANNKDGLANSIAANILNHLVGCVGKPGGVKLPSPSVLNNFVKPNSSHKQLSELSDKMANGEIEALFILNANPVYNLPEKTQFLENLRKVPLIVSFSSFLDDTTSEANLVLPNSTYLESWDSYVPLTDNSMKTIGLSQPVISKLYSTEQVADTLISISKIIGGSVGAALPWANFKDYLTQTWKQVFNEAKTKNLTKSISFNAFWNESLQKGGFWETTESNIEAANFPKPEALMKPSLSENENKDFKFHLQPYPARGLYDGSGANLPWLQQLPEPLVTGTWGTWAEINPETAKEMELSEGDLIDVETESGTISLPAYIFPAIHPETIAIPIGQGHKNNGRYAKNRGTNILKILDLEFSEGSEDLAWSATMAKISKGEGNTTLAKTDPGAILPGIEEGLRELDREIVQWISPEEAEKLEQEEIEPIDGAPELDKAKGPTTPAIPVIGLKPRKYPHQYRWGMIIDLDKCTGCQSCMVACYAENNLPIVSEEEIRKYRHKNWMRLDRYWEGEYPKIRAKIIPVNCYQCGKAPCETVCPVYAAFRTSDGINGQVYQRCIGSRYCNANCPYRSRLFNWLNPEWPAPLDQQLNQELSVRSSGVTDKCTFCANRIRAAKEIAQDENRKVKDGEIQPACAQTCPSGAIVFGDLLDHSTKASKLTRNPRRFRVLEEVNTEPGVMFLKAIREGAEEKKAHGEGAEEKETHADEDESAAAAEQKEEVSHE